MLEKHNVYFINRFGERNLLENDVTELEAREIIAEFLEALEFKSYYTRSWKTDEGTMYDVGSYTEFFLWGRC